MKKRVFLFSSFFIVLSILVMMELTMTLDNGFYQFFVSHQTQTTVNIAKILSFFGSTKGLIAVCLVLIFLLPDNKKRFYSLLSLLLSGILIILTKNIFTRTRPLIGQQLLSDYSFPSGHTFGATVFYGLLLYYVSSSKLDKQKKTILSIFLSLFVVAIAMSRIVLGVHYVTDILGGFFLGVVVLSFLIYLYEKDKRKEKEKPLFQSCLDAFHGILDTIKTERNMFIHFLIAILVVIAGIFYKISFFEWLICLLLFGSVLALELVNTALENVVDLVTKEKKEEARLAKDAAAGAVLVMAIFAGITGIMIFLPKLLG